jgi:putative transposase
MCRRHGISPATFHKWTSRFGGLEVSDAKKLRLLADAMLDNAMLRDVAARNGDARREAERGGPSVRPARGEPASGVRRTGGGSVLGPPRQPSRQRRRAPRPDPWDRRRAPALRLSARPCPAQARGRRGEPQDAQAALRRGEVAGEAPWRTQARARHAAANVDSGRRQPALEPRFRLGRLHRRPPPSHPGRRRRLDARVPGARSGHLDLRRPRGPRARRGSRAARSSRVSGVRQRHGTDQHGDLAMVRGAARGLALHRDPLPDRRMPRIRREGASRCKTASWRASTAGSATNA